jgi:hypothetical protein
MIDKFPPGSLVGRIAPQASQQGDPRPGIPHATHAYYPFGEPNLALIFLEIEEKYKKGRASGKGK